MDPAPPPSSDSAKSSLARVSIESTSNPNPSNDASALAASLDAAGSLDTTLTAGRRRRRSEFASAASEDECSDKVPRGQALSKTPAQVFLRSTSKSSHVAPAREAREDIELSPVTPSDQRIPDTPSQDQIAAFRRHGRIHFAALCYSSFLNGWNDGSTGPLLPRIEQNYHVGFSQRRARVIESHSQDG